MYVKLGRKKKELPLLENVTITDIAAEGRALTRVDNMVIFVPYVVPGDVVDLQLKKKKNSYAEAVAVKFHQYSDERAEAFCRHYGVCGGCKWQILPYEEQLRFKQKQVTDTLTRIGKVKLPETLPIIGSKQTMFYRNKLEYTFSSKEYTAQPPPFPKGSVDCVCQIGQDIRPSYPHGGQEGPWRQRQPCRTY